VQKASEAAQEYDKQSTASTQNFWGNDEDSSKKKSEAKKRKKSEAKKKKKSEAKKRKKKKSEAKKRKKSVNTKKNTEFGFDFGKIGRNFGFGDTK
jgi:ribosomal protein L9